MSRPTLGRMMSRRTRAVLCLLLIRLTANAPAQADSRRGEAALPRYQFQVGQEFVYSYRDENVDEARPRGGGPVQKSRSVGITQWRIWVLEKNADGSWRLLVDRETRETGLDRHVEVSARVLHEFDIFPDGRLVARRVVGDHLGDANYPTPLFVSLPADKHELAGEWRSPTNVGSAPPIGRVDPPGGRTFRCSVDSHRTGSGGGSLAIHCRQHRPGDGVPGMTKTRVCSFDVAAGRLVGFEEELTDDSGNRGSHCVATAKLVSVSDRPAAWLAELKHEADAFSHRQVQYDAETESLNASQSIKECTDLLTRIRSSLTTARESAPLEPIREQYAALLKRLDEVAKWALPKAKGREELATGPADWELSDFEGRPHRLRDYRGRVVVLDFWYKGCGWCIKAMPQINELAEAYKSKGVAVLGMNVDEEDEDALSVIRREHPVYATLKARPTEKVYRVDDFGCPFFIILDQTGRVRHVECGYSPDLAKRLGKVIDRLASAPPPAR
jgi:thiol-disulfide isomerase/thioredoxin